MGDITRSAELIVAVLVGIMQVLMLLGLHWINRKVSSRRWRVGLRVVLCTAMVLGFAVVMGILDNRVQR